ncbi:hypothetical protein ES705_08724 [subsurface metagenome]
MLISSVVILSVLLGIFRFYPGWNVALGKIPINLQGEVAGAVKASAIFFLLNLPLTITKEIINLWAGPEAYGGLLLVIVLGAIVMLSNW